MTELNKLIDECEGSGFAPGMYYVLSGMVGVGKSHYFSKEMSKQEWIKRYEKIIKNKNT